MFFYSSTCVCVGNSATSLIIPAATLGALGYGYMWWKVPTLGCC